MEGGSKRRPTRPWKSRRSLPPGSSSPGSARRLSAICMTTCASGRWTTSRRWSGRDCCARCPTSRRAMNTCWKGSGGCAPARPHLDRPGPLCYRSAGTGDRSMALSAFILIEVAGDHTKSAYKTIQRISGVKAVYTVSGNYDLIVQIETENLQTLSDLLVSKIRAVDGVTKTNTCLVLNV